MCRFHKIWELQPPETLRACPDLYRHYFSLSSLILIQIYFSNCKYIFTDLVILKITDELLLGLLVLFPALGQNFQEISLFLLLIPDTGVLISP